MTEQTSALNEAVATVMAHVKRLEKGDSNKFADYKYTSVDDFKDAIRPLLAAQGVVVHGTEVGAVETTELTNTKGQKTVVARYVYSFTLGHKSGEKGDPEQITIMLPYTGAQTSGAARSYAFKEWAKGRFLMSSGDVVDADADPQHEYSGKGENGFPPGNKDVKYTKTTGTTPGAVKAQDNNAFYAMLQREIDDEKTKDGLRRWRRMREIDMQERVGPEAMLHLSERYENAMAALP